MIARSTASPSLIDITKLSSAMMLGNMSSSVLSQLDRLKESFLWAAAKGGRVEECESLLEMGTDINWVSPEGDTPLLAACRNGHLQTALCLLSHGASANQVDKDGRTALHVSCRHGKEAVAEALILRGADVSARDHGGATAFESQGPHVPDGMLQRLDTIAQRSGRRTHHDPGISTAATNTSTFTTSSGRGAQDGGGLVSSRRSNTVLDSDTLSARATGGGVPENISGDGRPGWRWRSNTGRIEYNVPLTDDAHDGAADVGPAAISTGDGGRDDAQREERGGGEGRTTFPSISRKAGSTSADSRSSSRVHSAGRAASSSGDGVRSSDDEHDELLHEDETRRRFLSSAYRGPGVRQRGSLPIRNRSTGTGDEMSESMQLISAGEPVPHASAAIAAAIASASAPAPATTVTAAGSTIYPIMASNTLASPAPGPTSLRSPRRPLYFDGTPTASWDGAGADGGAGHGITVSNNRDSGSGGNRRIGSGSASGGSSSSSSSSSSSNSGRGGGGERQSRPAASATDADSPATATGTTATTTTVTPTCGLYGSLSTNAVAERINSRSITAHWLSPPAGVEVRGPLGDHPMHWGGRTNGDLVSGDAPYASIAPAGAGGRGVLGGGGHGGDPAQGDGGSSDHVGLIRALWLQEKESRLASEAKADAVRDQSARLWNELVRSEKQVLSLEEGAAALRVERDKLKATLNGEGFKGRSLQELEHLEKDLRKALEGVCGERDRIVQQQLAKEEQRLCVVCQENERSVLLLPCRHLCVCRGCSERQELTLCPLCRDHITQSLVVYS